MNESYLEIVELENGEIVLRPVAFEDEDVKPLVILKVSKTIKQHLQDKYFELAKHMFSAGIEYIYSDDFIEQEELEGDEEFSSLTKTIH